MPTGKRLTSTVTSESTVRLDIEEFEIKSYSVWGMQGSQDPPATVAGSLNVEILSGDPKEGPLHMLPFVVVGCLGIIIVILLVTKKRS